MQLLEDEKNVGVMIKAGLIQDEKDGLEMAANELWSIKRSGDHNVNIFHDDGQQCFMNFLVISIF